MPARRWSLLVVLTSACGLGAFGMLGVSPLSPALMQGFALSRLDVAFIVPSAWCSRPPTRTAPRGRCSPSSAASSRSW